MIEFIETLIIALTVNSFLLIKSEFAFEGLMNVDSRFGPTGHSWAQSVSAGRADVKRTSTMQRPKTVIDYVTSGARPAVVKRQLPVSQITAVLQMTVLRTRLIAKQAKGCTEKRIYTTIV